MKAPKSLNNVTGNIHPNGAGKSAVNIKSVPETQHSKKKTPEKNLEVSEVLNSDSNEDSLNSNFV